MIAIIRANAMHSGVWSLAISVLLTKVLAVGGKKLLAGAAITGTLRDWTV